METISTALGEEVSKSNIKSSLQRYYYSDFSHSNVVNGVQINSGSVCTNLPENELNQTKSYQDAKLETVPELIKEGLSIEQIARVLKIPLELVQQQIQNSE